MVFLFVAVVALGCKKKDLDLNTVFTGETEGCSSFRVWKFNDKKSVGCSVSGTRSAIGLDGTADVVIDLDTVSKNDLWVMIREFRSTPGIFQCTNTIDFDQNTALLWEATEGIATLRIDADNLSNNTYRMTVILDNVTFTIQGGSETLDMDHLEFNEVLVGD